MVEDISFPKNLPKVSRTNRVKRTARQSKHDDKQPFHKYLNQKEDQQEDGESGQNPDKHKRKNKPARTEHDSAAGPSPDSSNDAEKDTHGKRIDVHV